MWKIQFLIEREALSSWKKSRWELPGEVVAWWEKEEVSSLSEEYRQTIFLVAVGTCKTLCRSLSRYLCYVLCVLHGLEIFVEGHSPAAALC